MIACQRDAFSLPETGHYLNAAYMTPLPRAVEAAGVQGLFRKRNPTTITASDFFEEADAVRVQFARLIQAGDPNRIALIPAASYGLAIAARNVSLQAGQQIVVLEEQFPSNFYTWQRLADAQRATVRIVTPPANAVGRGAAWNEALLAAIGPETAVVAIPHVHWSDGTLFDLQAIRAHTRSVGAALIVDGTQSVGAFPFDVQAIQPDALICASYKWLLGPYASGLAYFGPRFDDGIPLEENWINRRGSDRFSELVNYEPSYLPGALRYDVGERSNFIAVPMMKAGLDLLLHWGVEDIQAYCHELVTPLLQTARRLGCVVENEGYRCAHLVGLRLPDPDLLPRLEAALRRHHISVSLRGTAIRVAPHVYNERADILALQGALEEALA